MEGRVNTCYFLDFEKILKKKGKKGKKGYYGHFGGVHLIGCVLRAPLREMFNKNFPTGFFECAPFGRFTRPWRRSFGKGLKWGVKIPPRPLN